MRSTLGLLSTAIEDQVGAKLGAQPGELSDRVSSGDIQVMTPEQARELGIDLEKIGDGNASSMTIRTQVLPFSTAPRTANSDDQAAEAPAPGTEPERNPEVTVIETTAVNDPEVTRRIQQHLESGDTDALARELKSLLQDSIDGAAIKQLLQPPAEETSTAIASPLFEIRSPRCSAPESACRDRRWEWDDR